MRHFGNYLTYSAALKSSPMPSNHYPLPLCLLFRHNIQLTPTKNAIMGSVTAELNNRARIISEIDPIRNLLLIRIGGSRTAAPIIG